MIMNNLIDLIFSENDKYALYKSTFKKTFIENNSIDIDFDLLTENIKSIIKNPLSIDKYLSCHETNEVSNINIFSSTPLNIGSVSSLLSSIPSEKITRYV